MSECSPPPTKPVQWRVVDRLNPSNNGIVINKSWYDAKKKGCILLGCHSVEARAIMKMNSDGKLEYISKD